MGSGMRGGEHVNRLTGVTLNGIRYEGWGACKQTERDDFKWDQVLGVRACEQTEREDSI